MSHTLYISDLDGTLLTRGAALSDYTVETLRALSDRGLLFSFATARSFHSAGMITAPLGLTTPVVTYNGTLIQDPRNGRILESCVISREVLAPLLAAFEREGLHPMVNAFIDGRDRVSWHARHDSARIRNYVANHQSDIRLRRAESYAELFAGDIFYITLADTKDRIERWRELLPLTRDFHVNYQRDTYNPDLYWLEISRADGRKDCAAKKVQAMVGADRLVCFGDSNNDIPLFEAADAGYAVANALAEVQKLAAGVIGSNEEDGVARWLADNAALIEQEETL